MSNFLQILIDAYWQSAVGFARMTDHKALTASLCTDAAHFAYTLTRARMINDPVIGAIIATHHQLSFQDILEKLRYLRHFLSPNKQRLLGFQIAKYLAIYAKAYTNNYVTPAEVLLVASRNQKDKWQ